MFSDFFEHFLWAKVLAFLIQWLSAGGEKKDAKFQLTNIVHYFYFFNLNLILK